LLFKCSATVSISAETGEVVSDETRHGEDLLIVRLGGLHASFFAEADKELEEILMESILLFSDIA
jgi:hypothetical protein